MTFQAMRRRARRGALAFLITAAALGAGPAATAPAAATGAQLRPVLDALEREEWGAARALAERMAEEPAAAVLATWRQLSRGDASFGEYRAFLERHPDWPARDRLRRRAEGVMPFGLRADDVVAFFAAEPPLTGGGALRLAEAQAALGRRDAARDAVVRAWRELSLDDAEEAALLQGWGGDLAPHHAARLDMLLWRGLAGEAGRMLGRVDAGLAALARARLALRAGSNGVDGVIARIPAALRDDPGLAYERFRWRAAKGLADGAEEMIRAASPDRLGRASAWSARRVTMARDAARSGRPEVAYELASRHGLRPEDGYDYADLEWIAGWVALRQLRDPARAEAHFARFTAAVGTPISLGRGHYWLGRAREARGDAAGAREAYREGARWQTSFYGQLAAERGGAAPDPALAGVGAPTDWRDAAVMATPLVRAGVMAHWAGDRGLSHWLLTHAAGQAATPRDLAALGALALEVDRPEVAVRIAKAAARDALVLIDPYYPVTPLAQAQAAGPLVPSVVMAIARQESELNPEAISPAGARGLMQLMPGTAQLVSRRLGVGYSLAALTGDWRYNARLGTDYLAGLMDEFGSLPLAAAGYNAGPGRVREWLRRFGDPRGRGEDAMVDWIETIPFNETRNYVQRVLEGVQIYDARLSGATAPHRAVARLR